MPGKKKTYKKQAPKKKKIITGTGMGRNGYTKKKKRAT